MADLSSDVTDLVHEPTQVHEGGVDLTAAGVHEVTEPGRIDFGGGELAPADAERIVPERRSPDDDYGWWNLQAGRYLLTYNESLAPPEGERLVVQPRRELVERGGSHPTLHRRTLGPVPLSVPDGGLRLKENARVSTVVGRSRE